MYQLTSLESQDFTSDMVWVIEDAKTVLNSVDKVKTKIFDVPEAPFLWFAQLSKTEYETLKLEFFLKRDLDKVEGYYEIFQFKVVVVISGYPHTFELARKQVALKNSYLFNIGKMHLIDDLLVDGNMKLNFTVVVTQRDLTRGLISKADKRNLAKHALRDISSLLENGSFSDLTIAVADGTKFKVHKAILAARSEIFRKRFSEDPESNNVTFKLEKVDSESFEMFLKFIYKGEFDASPNASAKLMVLAEMFAVHELKELCAMEMEIAEKLTTRIA